VRHVVTHLASFGVLLAAFLSAGVLVEHLVRPFKVQTAAGLTRLTLGIIFWIAVLFVLASAGVLRLSMVGSITSLVIVLAAPLVWADRRSFVADVRARFRKLRPDVTMVLLGAAGIVLMALLFASLTPEVGWDPNVAHLTLPKLYLANGGFRRVPFNVYSYWPLNIQLLYAFAMLIHDYVLAKLLNLMFLVLCMVAVYRLASRHSSAIGGSCAAMLTLANPVLLDEARFAYIDLGFAFFFVMAFAFALEHLESRRLAPLVLAGVCCGAIAGTKLLGAVAAPCIAITVVVARLKPNPTADSRPPTSFSAVEMRRAIRDVVLCIAVPAFMLALPWYFRSYWYAGNPFYPLFYAWFGGPEWNASLTQQFYVWQQSIGMGRQWFDYLLLPFRVVLSGGDDYRHFDGRVSQVWVIVVPLSLALSGSNRITRPALGVAGLYFVTWAATSQQARFLIPILPLLAIAGGVAIDNVLARFPAIRPARMRLIAVAGSVLLLWSTHVVVMDGARAGRGMLTQGVSVPGAAKGPLYQFIDDRLPPDARLMLLNTNQGFFVDREYVADSFFEASQMNALMLDGSGNAPELSRRLRARGITHVLLSTDEWEIPYPPALREFLNDRGLTELMYSCPDRTCFLFRIRGGS
jgi:4-amino-4-deoxy-L-arabinose transferase-like glycosyltransferase